MLAALSPAAIVRGSARRPWLTLGIWIVAVVLAGLAAALWLGDSLTTANRFTSVPEAEEADRLIGERFFPPGPREVTEILYVHAPGITVDDAEYQAFVEDAYQVIMALGPETVPSGFTYYQLGAEQMVSLDRSATGLVFTLVDDFLDRLNRDRYLDAVEALDADDRFALYPLRTPGSSRPETIIVESATYDVEEPEFRQFVEDLLLQVIALGRDVIGGGATYYATGDASLVGRDGNATLVPVILNDWGRLSAVIAIVEEARAAADFDVWITGAATVDHDFTELSERDLQQGEFQFGLPAAILVLVLVLGTIVAAAVPLIVAFLSIGVAMGLAALLGTTTDLSIFLINMVFMMGLAVGIDYGLFIIARFREERANGLSVEAAIGKAGNTASRAVLFSGITVVLSLAGLLFVPVTIFFSLGMGAILVVLVSVIASLTLLPAILRLLGDRIDRLRLPLVGPRFASHREGGLWERIARGVMRAPALALVVTAGLLVALAVPALGIKTGAAGVSSFPDSFESKRGFELLEEQFSTGVVGPTHVVIDGNAADPAVRAAADALKADLAADAAFGPVVEEVSEAGDTIWLRTPITSGDATSAEAVAAVGRLRDDYIPAAFSDVPARALVTGDTAGNMDWFDVADSAAIIVVPFVIILSFLLLTLVFRSVVIPVTAIIVNLLSAGAAYGLLVLVFQRGVGNELFGFQQVDTIEAWIPIFLFSVLFGLSMDYQVFLLSRIRERFAATGDNRDAIIFGVRSTGRLITGAALIMVAVFAGFASGDLVMFEQVGFGLGVAVLLDATLVRSVLVPASMRLLGRANWYLPRFLRWLPHVNIEGNEPPPSPVPAGTPQRSEA
ncbi:MAG: MMPL family transporter [Bauldia sp.]|nr:MMPL family transporter [Bauldia sp.]